MVQVLNRIPSVGERFAKAFAKGGVALGDISEKYAVKQAKLLAGRTKEAGKVGSFVPKLLKTHEPRKEYRGDELKDIEDRTAKNIMEGMNQHEAFNNALSGHKESKSTKAQEYAKQFNTPVETDEQRQFRHTHGRFTKEERDQLVEPYEFASAIKKHPGKGLANIAIDNLAGLVDLFGEVTSFGKYSKMAQELSGSKERSRTPLVDFLKNKAGIDELAPETQRALNKGSLVAGFLPAEAAALQTLKGVKGVPKGPYGPGGGFSNPPLLGGPGGKQIGFTSPSAGGPGTPPGAAANLARQLAPAEKAAAEFSPAKEAVQAVEEAGLSDRVTKQPRTGTELRIDRAQPGGRLYPQKAQEETLRAQMKAHPKYAVEIAQDEAEMLARRADQEPKTVKGMDNRRLRIATAEMKYPAIENAYQKSLARVRAIEDSIAKLPDFQKQNSMGLLNAAKKQLQEASIDLQRARSNLKGGSGKYTVEEATKRARDKIQGFEDAIDAGEEIKLTGHDYSPRMIEEARAIQKKKKLPSTTTDDFYNQIHEDYLRPYREKLAQVQGRLKDPKVMLDNVSRENARKLEDVLNKIIKSAEAEIVRHQHKLALRGIGARKTANDRFKQLAKSTEKETKASKLAQEKMWETQIRQATTPEQRAQVIDSAVDSIALQHPKEAESIIREGESFKEEVQTIFANSRTAQTPPPLNPVAARTHIGQRTAQGAGIGGGGQPPPAGPGPQQATGGAGVPPPQGPGAGAQAAQGAMHGPARGPAVRMAMNQLKGIFARHPLLAKYGGEVLVGIGTALVDELIDQIFGTDFPLTAGAIASATLRRGGPTKHRIGRGGAAVIANQLTRWVIRNWKTNNAIQEYLSDDDREREKWVNRPNSIKKRAREKMMEA